MALPTMVDGQGPRFFGVYPALVTRITEDPLRLGRVEVRFPGLGDDGERDVRAWATLCSPYADDKQGLQIMPEVDSQVVVAFEAGDFRRPYIVGAAWNGKAAQPHAPERSNNLRLLRSRADSRLEFDDSSGSPQGQPHHQVGTQAGAGCREPGGHSHPLERLHDQAECFRRHRDHRQQRRHGDGADGAGECSDLHFQRHRELHDAQRKRRDHLSHV